MRCNPIRGGANPRCRPKERGQWGAFVSDQVSGGDTHPKGRRTRDAILFLSRVHCQWKDGLNRLLAGPVLRADVMGKRSLGAHFRRPARFAHVPRLPAHLRLNPSSATEIEASSPERRTNGECHHAAIPSKVRRRRQVSIVVPTVQGGRVIALPFGIGGMRQRLRRPPRCSLPAL